MKRKGNYLIFENSEELYFLIKNVKRKIMKEENKIDIDILKNKIIDEIYNDYENKFDSKTKKELFKNIVKNFVKLDIEKLKNNNIKRYSEDINEQVLWDFINTFYTGGEFSLPYFTEYEMAEIDEKLFMSDNIDKFIAFYHDYVYNVD